MARAAMFRMLAALLLSAVGAIQEHSPEGHALVRVEAHGAEQALSGHGPGESDGAKGALAELAAGDLSLLADGDMRG